ncbi:MAG TPA: type II toxin-antitoxin system VapC family toxin [Thermoanaerobaculia bacterium]|nr:type II toxin-antitoxin system VapC family toxin [Thermoanaerobaculia bacterium]
MSSTIFLVDTNVLSELVRQRPDPGVLEWAQGIWRVALSSITVEEVCFGLAWKPAPRVARWFEEFLETHCEVLPVTANIARRSGELRGQLQARGLTRESADMLIASTAQVHQLTLVTRNVRHFVDCGISLLNPFREQPAR